MLAQCCLVGAGAGLEHDGGEYVLTVIFVRDANRRRLQHSGVREQRLINLARGDVFAALDDELLDAAGDEVKAIAVTVPQIAGAQPAVGC